ncbi:MAG: Arc family DNA-binding protein [Enterobacterales bacterium]|nr:Arc family DNA-binding protein [Enterobacterales bacterium]
MTKKAYPLRINEKILNAIQRWAADELRSVNSQIEYLLRDALRKDGRTEKLEVDPVLIEDDDKETRQPPRVD